MSIQWRKWWPSEVRKGNIPRLATVVTVSEAHGPRRKAGISCRPCKAWELVSDLVDGLLMVVMRCLRSGAPASKRRPRQ